ncbi:homeobox protein LUMINIDEPENDENS [Euphorbia lathyris]|uniref:homeobox protein LUMINIDEPENDENS n=1 Tax=Euphorbia lathyris TaxID=212925 RepID=UPI00331320A4
MNALKDNLEEIEIGSSLESFTEFLDSQKDLFHGQIDQLQRIVVTQCKLTGVNPLSQEMAAGAMSIKIGKRPRDLLNPKAIKYLQAVFSMKDAISKKESREISAQFGVTVTQVRDFFGSQRSRVKRLVRLSREKAARANAHKEPQNVVSTSCDPMMPIHIAPLSSIHPDPVPLDSVDSNSDPLNSIASNSLSLNHVNIDPVPLYSIISNSLPLNPVNPDSVPLNHVGTSSAEEMPSCSTQDDILPGLNDIEKHFVDNIFTLLRKEETFSGQVKLMEWILQIQNPSVLSWFLAKGGVMILATWLSQAAAEEQTSALHFSLKVLCHLPLHKALPEHMSAVLHSVNRLRFYRTSDISNRARILLSRWSKLFARSQAMKKPNRLRSSINAQEMILKQSIEEIMGNELWHANGDNPEDGLTLVESSENTRKNEPSQTLKLLPASTDDASRKHILGVSSSHARERRKVQYVEQPGQKTASRSPLSSKTVSVSQGRPMSTDDIQKAKMRALFMQNKYGKVGASSNGTNDKKTENLNKPSSTPPSTSLLASKVPLRPKVEEHKNFAAVPPNICNKHENHLVLKHKMGSKEHLEELYRKVQIPWQIPPEIKLQDIWRVGVGENSKEVDVQRNRNRREIETLCRTVQEIPSNPKEPWDIEMDYDDTLTPDIPVEQPPDADVTETQVFHNEERVNAIVTPTTTFCPVVGGGAAEPDLELLAVLLKNPELVFALTSGQASNISSEETLKLLDVIKRSGAGLATSSNGFSGKVEEKVEVSLPSPTPSSNPGTSGWRPEVAKNPFSHQNNRGNRISYAESGVPSTERVTGLLQAQNHANNIRMSQQQYFSLPQATSSNIIHDNRQPSMVIPSRQNLPASSSMLETGLPIKNIMRHNFSTANRRPSMRVEAMDNVKTAASLHLAPERRQVSLSLSSTMPMSTPNRSYSRTPLTPEPMHSSRQSTGNIGSMPESWRARQGLASNLQSRVNQNNHETSFRGALQARRERNEYIGEEGFESWSPENSPGRSPENMPGRNYTGGRSNGGGNYTHDNGSRQRNFDNHRDHNWNGNRRFR